MRSYQTLSLIGGILGIIIVFLAFIVMGSALALSKAFGGDAEVGDEIYAQIGLSIVLYIIAIVLPFVTKNTKPVGILLIVLSVSTLISAGYFGILGFALLLPAGIIAIRWKEKSPQNKPVDILKERFAKGEITKEEYDEKKKELE